MSKRKPNPKTERQINQYDKILQENIEAALPGLIKNILHINAVTSEELPDSIQHTKERKPDLLKKITDGDGNTFVLHIEFQTKNDAEMVYRMAEYWAMLLRSYKIPVKQYVIYIGEEPVTMPTSITNGSSYYNYSLISIATIDYHIFLGSDKPEEKVFAILGDFGEESPELVIRKIATDITKTANGDLEKDRLKNQLRVLAQLRNLASSKTDIMEHISTFFKEENDILYRAGEKKGIEQGTENTKTILVKNLLLQTDFTVTKIASLADTTEAFVRKIKREMQAAKS